MFRNVEFCDYDDGSGCCGGGGSGMLLEEGTNRTIVFGAGTGSIRCGCETG